MGSGNYAKSRGVRRTQYLNESTSGNCQRTKKIEKTSEAPPAPKHWKAELEDCVLMYQWIVIMLKGVVVGVITSQEWVCLIFYNCRYCYCYRSWYEWPASKTHPHRPQSQTQQGVVLSEKAMMNLRYTTYPAPSSRQTKKINNWLVNIKE